MLQITKTIHLILSSDWPTVKRGGMSVLQQRKSICAVHRLEKFSTKVDTDPALDGWGVAVPGFCQRPVVVKRIFSQKCQIKSLIFGADAYTKIDDTAGRNPTVTRQCVVGIKSTCIGTV